MNVLVKEIQRIFGEFESIDERLNRLSEVHERVLILPRRRHLSEAEAREVGRDESVLVRQLVYEGAVLVRARSIAETGLAHLLVCSGLKRLTGNHSTVGGRDRSVVLHCDRRC